MRYALLMVAVVALLAVACGGGDDDSSPTLTAEELENDVPQLSPEAVAIGKSIYEQSCATCHGINGEGQPNWREHLPDGRLPAPPHNGTGHTWHHGDGQLYDIVRNGGLSGMPAWGDKLSHEEILAALTYIKTFWDVRERVYQDALSENEPFPTPRAGSN